MCTFNEPQTGLVGVCVSRLIRLSGEDSNIVNLSLGCPTSPGEYQINLQCRQSAVLYKVCRKPYMEAKGND